MTRILVVALFVGLVSLPAGGQTLSTRTIERNLPRNYTGTFSWDSGGDEQTVDIRFDVVRKLEAGLIEAIGCGRYDASGVVTDIKVKMTISAPDLAIELFELEPEGEADFTVDGSHVGHLSDRLRHLVAVWTTRATGAKGRLDLRAGGKLSCSGAVARDEASQHPTPRS
jgi:hypothetical protein